MWRFSGIYRLMKEKDRYSRARMALNQEEGVKWKACIIEL